MRTIAQAKQTARGILAVGTALVALFVTLPMVGCGGGSKSSPGGSSVSKARGGFTFGVQWPDVTRVIPLAAKSIRVTLVRIVPGPTIQPVPVVPLLTPPPDTQLTNRVSNVTVPNLELGTYRITATAYPNPDGTGNPLAVTTVDKAVTPGTNAALTMTMVATITRLEISPATGPNLKIGRTRQFTVTAFDANNNLVMHHPNAIKWETLNGGIVTVDNNGLATMVGLGTGQIRATYVEPNITPGAEGTGDTVVATVNVVEVGLEDSPWPKFHGNLQNTGLATQGGPTAGLLEWQFNLDDSIVFSSPSIAQNGIVYVGAFDGNLYAINPDGSEKWKFQTGDVIESSPAISKDGVVYVGSMDNNIYALDGETGSVVWSRNLGAPVFASPTIGPDGTLYVGVTDPGVTMYALDSLNGDIVWDEDLGGGIQTCAAFNQNNNVIYVGALDGSLYALRTQDGQQLWDFPLGDSDFSSSPAVAPNGNIYIGSQDGTLYAVTQTGAAVPGFTPVVTEFPIFASPAIGADGTVYFGNFDNESGLDQNDMFAVDGTTGDVKWTFRSDGGFVSSPVIGTDGIIYVGSYDGNLYALNPDGADVDREKWAFFVGDNIDSSPAIGADGTVYVGAFNGRLFAVK